MSSPLTDIALKWLSTVIIVELIILLPQEEDPWADFQQNLVIIIIIIACQQIYVGLHDSSRRHLKVVCFCLIVVVLVKIPLSSTIAWLLGAANSGELELFECRG